MQLMERNAILQEFLRGSLEPETTQPKHHHQPLNSKLKAIKRNAKVNKDDFYEDFYFKGIHLRVKRRKKPNMEKTELFDCTGQ